MIEKEKCKKDGAMSSENLLQYAIFHEMRPLTSLLATKSGTFKWVKWDPALGNQVILFSSCIFGLALHLV